jgi:flagellar M-ring protein FliF
MALIPQNLQPALGQLFAPQRLGALVALAAMLAVLAGAVLWSRTPDYRVLYSNLSERDGGAIVAALAQLNVPYRVVEGGSAILVPADQVHELRLKLAGQGLPRGGLVGFEIMDTARLGTSQFLEQVNYHRALEGELARSVQSLAAVHSARVHLALPRPSVFVRERPKPSASVLVSLHPGRTLDAPQVNAILHLVSASVPELSVRSVTVVDQNGNLLSAAHDGAGGLDPAQLKYVHEVEAGYIRRIEAILEPLLGRGNVRAQVAAEIDFSQSERAEETFKPNQNEAAALRSRQVSESSGAPPAAAAGVPGALSNQPPAAGAPTAAAPAAAPAGGVSRRDLTVNYEVDRTVRHVRQPTGTLQRLSVAVVVNHRREAGTGAAASYRAPSEQEMAEITALVKEAVGYNERRGDTLHVTSARFTEPEPLAPSELPWWKRPESIELAKDIGRHLLIGVLALYLVLGVLRPLLRQLAQAKTAPAASASEPPAPQPPAALSYEQNLERARQIARQEPKLVANVVKSWVGGHE